MSVSFAEAIFFPSLIAMIVGSVFLSPAVDRLGEKFRLSLGLIGLLTALAADSPEIASAVTAITGGQQGVGVGVVLGSALFNLAMLMGLSAVIAGPLGVRTRELTFHGVVGMAILLVIAGLITAFYSAVAAILLLAAFFIPYAALLAMRSAQIERLPLPSRMKEWLSEAAGSEETQENAVENNAEALANPDAPPNHYDSGAWGALDGNGAARVGAEQEWRRQLSWKPVLVGSLALLAVISGSVGLVDSSVRLAAAWHISQDLVGTILIAALTGFPNAYSAIQLARQKQGPAVISEALNSNTIVLLVGIGIPALIYHLSQPGLMELIELGWLIVLTLIALLLCARCKGLNSTEGAVLLALYAIFVGWRSWAA